MPRRPRRVARNPNILDAHSVLSAATVASHRTAVGEFEAFLKAEGSSLDLSIIARVPTLMDSLLTAFGRKLFAVGAPIYLFRYSITGVQQLDLGLRHQLPYAWHLLAKWESITPSVHRTPIPQAVYQAMVAVALAWGLVDWAATTMLTYWAPARCGEPQSATRGDLTLPDDFLLGHGTRVLLRILKPKSRGRGPKIQHAGFDRLYESRFLTFAYGALRPTDPLYPASSGRYRKIFDLILAVLGVPAGVYTPGGFRGGGAVTAYLAGRPISEIQWDMRLTSQDTLRYYLQEVAASNSMLVLPVQTREAIRVAAGLYEVSLQATMEVAS